MPPTSTSEAGFTLVEVLVAFAAAAALVAAAALLQGATAEAMRRAELRAGATEAARSALARAGVLFPLEAGERSWTEGPFAVRLAMAPEAQGLMRVEALAEAPGAAAALSTLRRAP